MAGRRIRCRFYSEKDPPRGADTGPVSGERTLENCTPKRAPWPVMDPPATISFQIAPRAPYLHFEVSGKRRDQGRGGGRKYFSDFLRQSTHVARIAARPERRQIIAACPRASRSYAT